MFHCTALKPSSPINRPPSRLNYSSRHPWSADMSDIRTVETDDDLTCEVSLTGHDRSRLVFQFLDELLFRFSTDGLICNRVTVTQLEVGDGKECALTMQLRGEQFDIGKHPQGTEVKAITYRYVRVLIQGRSMFGLRMHTS